MSLIITAYIKDCECACVCVFDVFLFLAKLALRTNRMKHDSEAATIVFGWRAHTLRVHIMSSTATTATTVVIYRKKM